MSYYLLLTLSVGIMAAIALAPWLDLEPIAASCVVLTYVLTGTVGTLTKAYIRRQTREETR
jgi:hypothetical protein